MTAGKYTGQIRYDLYGSKEERFLVLDFVNDAGSYAAPTYQVYLCKEGRFGVLNERFIKEFTLPLREEG
jgi:hypothetical protein